MAAYQDDMAGEVDVSGCEEHGDKGEEEGVYAEVRTLVIKKVPTWNRKRRK